MKTLYDLLGALPSDDAEGLRTAFRKAVKGAHPDLYPGDPDAALKFRQIVRANEILGDAGQRAAYDDLLELARLEQKSASEYAIAAKVHKLASGVIALAGVSVVTVGGYLLFTHMSAAWVASANKVDVRGSTEIVRFSPTESPDTTNNSASPVKHESISVAGEAIVPTAAMTQPNAEGVPAANVGPAPKPAASAARSLRAQGILAYRNGELNGPIADLFSRLRKFDRVFADIGRAKRIEKASRSKAAQIMARKRRFDLDHRLRDLRSGHQD
jgi:curved DNA-binding protein CbpA